MVDYFSLALSHGVILLAFWRLVWRDDLDRDSPRQEAVEEPAQDTGRSGPLRRA